MKQSDNLNDKKKPKEKTSLLKEIFQNDYLNKKIPFGKYEFKTLNGTNNKYWFAYIPELNISFKSIKKTDIIIEVWEGRQNDIYQKSAPIKLENFLKNLLLDKSYTPKNLKWYQRLRIEFISTFMMLRTLPLIITTILKRK